MSFLVPLALSLATLQGDQALDRWRFHFEEQALQKIWVDVSQENAPRTMLFEHAGLLGMSEPSIQEDTAVLVQDGRIAWIGPSSEAVLPPEGVRVDARGKFLMPGLVDMHVHHRTHAQALLSLANGVTSERELCGFPWELEQRERIRAGVLLAPDLHLSGHILNERGMGIFATVVKTPEEARVVVRRHVEEGYDFIKVHNNMSLSVYSAILAEADRLGVRVVGHIPQDVTIEEALALGQHTLEHFKGYILDRGLELTDEDYVALTDGSGVWNCPTLSTRVIGLIRDEAFEYFDSFDGIRYVSIFDRERWLANAETRDPKNSHARVWELSQEIFEALLKTDARFLAGSDSGGGYDNQVPGFMLHEELRLMEELGLPTFACLQAATTNAAEALESEEFGIVEVGKRADLVLLDANPLETVRNLRSRAGVMLGGVWLSRATIDAFLRRIEAVYAHEEEGLSLRAPTEDELDAFVVAMEELHAGGFVFMDNHVDEIAELLRARDRGEDAARVESLRARRP